MFPGIILFVAVCLYRLLPLFMGVTTEQPAWMFNFSPIAALCLCGAACFPKRLAITLPFASLLLTDAILSRHYGWPVFNAEFAAKTLVFAAVFAFGWQLRSNPRLRVLLPSVVGSSIFFYITTNTASWIYDPGYIKNAAGWMQAVTVGLPGFPSTWSFYQNTLISDVLFTLLFVGCMRVGRGAPAPQSAELHPARW